MNSGVLKLAVSASC